jgi:hypothetical protein
MRAAAADHFASPLTDRQKERILDLVEENYRDRIIADLVGCSEHQVQSYRQKCGVLRGPAATPAEDRAYNATLRPRHVQGAAGEDVWFASCDAAFKEVVRTAGGW